MLNKPENERNDAPVWVTGAGGLIGSYLVKTFSAKGLSVRGITHREMELTNCGQVMDAFVKDHPAAVIHCAAISSSVICQQNPGLARRVNVFTTRFLSDIASDIPFFLFSTDLVFDGKQGDYHPEDTVNPLSIYGETKAEAEQYILSNPRHTVIRTSLNGGISPRGSRGFNEEIRNAWRAGKELCLFSDEYRCPIAAKLTAEIVTELLEKQVAGIVHVAGGKRLSRYEIATLLAGIYTDVKPLMREGSLREYKGAPRAPDTSLDISQTEELLGHSIPGLGEWLQQNPNEPF